VDYNNNLECENMDGLVLAFIALKNEFRPLQKPLAEPGFKPFDLSALARRYSVEEVRQDLLMLTAKRRFAHETRQ
jgi:hypothetical protein